MSARRLIAWLKRLVTRAAGPPPAPVLAPSQEMPTAADTSPLTDEVAEEQPLDEGDFAPFAAAWQTGYAAGVADTFEQVAVQRKASGKLELVALQRALASHASPYAVIRSRQRPPTAAAANGSGRATPSSVEERTA